MTEEQQKEFFRALRASHTPEDVGDPDVTIEKMWNKKVIVFREGGKTRFYPYQKDIQSALVCAMDCWMLERWIEREEKGKSFLRKILWRNKA